MDLDILDQIVYKNLNRRAFEAPPGNYDPSLVIGLGGTGVTVLRQLKACMGNSPMPAVQLLAIDSAKAEFEPKGLPPFLSSSEQILLEPGISTRALDLAAAGDPDYSHILEYLPEEADGRKNIHADVRTKIETGQGAGQFRRAGKLVFNCNTHDGARIKNRLIEIKDSLVGAARQNDESRKGQRVTNKMQVFVVCSAAGGTGAGILLDTLALLRSMFNNSEDRIHVLMLLPGLALDQKLSDPVIERAQTRANALGLLRELQAFHMQEVKDFDFQFAPHDRYRHTGNRALFHSMTLIDHERADGTQILDWKELNRAAAYYLYSIVGTGLGANQHMGGINADGADAEHWLRAIGVSVLEVPEIACRHLVVRELFDAFSKRVLHKTKVLDAEGKEVSLRDRANTLVTTFLQKKRLGDVSSFLSSLPRPRGMEDIFSFADTPTQEKSLMGKWDPEFLRASQTAREMVGSDVAKLKDPLAALFDEYTLGLVRELDEEVRSILPQSLPLALRFLEMVSKEITRLEDEVLKSLEALQRQTADDESDLETLAKKINFWDLGLDRKLRRRHIQKTQDVLHQAMDRCLLRHGLSILDGMDDVLRDLQAKTRTVYSECRLLQMNNRERLTTLYRSSTTPIFVHDAVSLKDFGDMWKSSDYQTLTTFTSSRYDLGTLFSEAMAQDKMEAAIQSLLAGVEVVKSAKETKPGKDRLKTLQHSSTPLLGLSPAAPMPSQLKPLHYLAAAVDEVKDQTWATKLFPAEQAAIKLVATGDADRAIFVRTMGNISLEYWKQLELALPFYRQQEWRSHTLPHYDKLPPLKKSNQETDHALETFGLALAMNAVHVSGSNYYGNLQFTDKRNDATPPRLAVFSKNRTTICNQLLQAGKLIEAQTSRTRTRKENLLGQGLEAAIESLKEPVSGPFVEEVRTILLDDYRNAFGASELKSALNTFASDSLDQLVSKADGERRELLQQMQERLLALSRSLNV